jgi:hypothetical protein
MTGFLWAHTILQVALCLVVGWLAWASWRERT